MATPRLTLFVRRGCHLCDAAEQALAPLVNRLGLAYGRADIDTPEVDPLLRAHYDAAVPVLHIDGVEVARGRIDTRLVEGNLALRDTVLVVMAKYPVPGKVKTRLAVGPGALTPERAAELHGLFLRTELSLMSGLGARSTVLCFDPPEAEVDFDKLVQDWSLPGPVSLLPQSGGDLGERLASAFEALTGASLSKEPPRVLFFGADTPHLTPNAIRDAAAALCSHPAVVGPSSDGGYWTIGVTPGVPLREILYTIPWSSGGELAATVEQLRRRGYPPHLTALLDDVDRPADLAGLANLLATTGVSEHQTLLRRLGRMLSPLSS